MQGFESFFQGHRNEKQWGQKGTDYYGVSQLKNGERNDLSIKHLQSEICIGEKMRFSITLINS